jgi:hypothetical protein
VIMTLITWSTIDAVVVRCRSTGGPSGTREVVMEPAGDSGSRVRLQSPSLQVPSSRSPGRAER